MLKLDLSRDAGDFVAALPGKQFKQVVSAMLALLNNPQPHEARPVVGAEGLFRVDIGEVRIVYRVEGGLLRTPLIGKPNDGDGSSGLARKI
jgi:mRNA interferase RelE/StbE